MTEVTSDILYLGMYRLTILTYIALFPGLGILITKT